nr:virion core protein [Wadden Sea poxvirus]
MDFMDKYIKSLTDISKLSNDSILYTRINDIYYDNNNDNDNDNDNVNIKNQENEFQKMIKEKLEEKNLLKVKDTTNKSELIIYTKCPQTTLKDDNKISSDEVNKLKIECENIKSETKNIQDETSKLLDDISTVRNDTMDSINALIKELTQKFQLSNLSTNST